MATCNHHRKTTTLTLKNSKFNIFKSTFILILFLTFDLKIICADDPEIILNGEDLIDDSSLPPITSRSNTFYSVESSNTSINGTNDDNNNINNNITIEVENESINNNNSDDFWDVPSPPISISSSSSSSANTENILREIERENAIHTTTFIPPSLISSSMSTWSTLPPPFTNIRRTSPFVATSQKPKENENENTFETALSKIWKLVLHGTNMNSEELRMCNTTLIENHFKPSSRRKVARNIKKELEKKFSKWNYRFSILVSTTSRNTMGKALHGVWMSISINGIHYFITATHPLIDGPKIKEDQMEKIEYWAYVHAIGARNMTGFKKFNRIALKLKQDLDRYYGNGNVWSVVVVKNPLLVKAKVFEDPEYHIEFTRLNGGHFIVWRGGQNIDDGSRHARDLLIPESDDNSLESETEHENYLNNIYLLTW